MERRHVELWAPGIDAHGVVIAYGHFGRPLLAFPTERGRAWEYENRGMVGAITGLIEAGRVKLYCVDSLRRGVVVERSTSRSRTAPARHGRYEAWILEQVVPWIHGDCGGAQEILYDRVAASA